MEQSTLLNRQTIASIISILICVTLIMGFINYELLSNPNGVYVSSFYFLVLVDILTIALIFMIVRLLYWQVKIRISQNSDTRRQTISKHGSYYDHFLFDKPKP